MSSIFLIEGPVGAGKSTYAAKLSEQSSSPHLDLDEWMVTLFSPDRPRQQFFEWYALRKQRCIEQIWLVAEQILSSGSNVILELGLVQAQDRDDFYRRVDTTAYPMQIHFLDTSIDERRRRVVQRNRQQSATYKMQVSDEMFELANDFWEEPSPAEYRERDILVISNG